MDLIRYFHMTLAFGLELSMLTAYGYWGYLQGKSTSLKYLFASLIVIAAIILWGLFAAPKANYRLSFYPRLFLELGMFLLAAFLLYQSGDTTLSFWMAGLSCLSILLAFILER